MCNGACQAGPCLVTLAANQSGAVGIAVNAINVYWTDQDGVMSAPINGGTPTTVASSESAWAIALDATNIYWTNTGSAANNFTDGSVMQCPIGGGSTTIMAGQQVNPQSIAVDASSVYWVSGQTVMEEAIVGGAAKALASPMAPISGLAVGTTDVYFTVGAAPGAVMSVPIAGGPAATLVTSAAPPTAIAVNSSGVYWAGAIDGHAEIFGMPFGAANPTDLDGETGTVFLSVAVDDATVYWTLDVGSGQMGQVGSVPINASPSTHVETLATNQGLNTSANIGLAVDATSVYWIANNAVYKLSPK